MTFKTIMLAGSAAVTLMMGATAAWAVSATGTATANIAPAAGTVSVGADLNFGNITPGASGSGLVIVPATVTGTPSTTGGVLQAGASRGTFVVTTSAASYSVILPAAAVLNGTTGSLAVSNFVSDTPPLDAGAATIGIGARLTVLSGSAVGTYTGQYTIDVNFGL